MRVARFRDYGGVQGSRVEPVLVDSDAGTSGPPDAEAGGRPKRPSILGTFILLVEEGVRV